MSKIIKNRWLKISTALATLISSSRAGAIDLQSKIKNADRTDFNTVSTPFKKKLGQYSIIGEISDTKQPLIQKQANGSSQTLIDGLQAFELSFLYEMTDSLQIGILVPGEKPYGMIGSYNEAKSYLGNIMIEPKIYISGNIALIPVYYVPTSNNDDLLINGVKTPIDLGHKNGAYGLKASAGIDHNNGIKTAYQIGAIIAPESKFRDLDQTMTIQFGAGVKKELSGGLKLLAEAYGEKYKTNTPLEALAMIEYSNDKFMVRMGGGTGDLQGSGSNTVRLLANFAYYFGEDKKTSPSEVESVKLSTKPVDPEDYKKFKQKVEKTEDQIIDDEEKQNNEVPQSSNRQIPFLAIKIKKDSTIPVTPFSEKQSKFLATIEQRKDEDDISFVRNMSDTEFEKLFHQTIDGKNFSNTIQRSVASIQASKTDLLAKIENIHVTPTAIFEIKKRDYHWTEPKAKYVLLNMKRANLNLKENINLYNKLVKAEKDTTKVLAEINWGIRVFQRNVNSWNLLIASYMEETGESVDRMDLNSSVIGVNYTVSAIAILNETKTNTHAMDSNIALQETQEYVVNVISKLNLRQSPMVALTNLVGSLRNGDVVRTKSGVVLNKFVEIEIVKSSSFVDDFKKNLFVHAKYLVPVESKMATKEDVLTQVTPAPEMNSLLDDFSQATKDTRQNVKNIQNINDIANIFKVAKEQNKSSMMSVAETKMELAQEEPIPEVPTKIEQMNKIKEEVVSETKTADSVVEEKSKISVPVQEVFVLEPSIPVKAQKVTKKKVKKVVHQPKVKVETITTQEPEVKAEVVEQVKPEAKSSRIEIVYDEPAVKPAIKAQKAKVTNNKLPEKKVQTIIVEKISSAEDTSVKVKSSEPVIVEVKSETPAQTEVIKTTVVEVVSDAKSETKVEVITQPQAETKVETAPQTQAEPKVETKVEAVTPAQDKEAKIKKEIAEIDLLIELKSAALKKQAELTAVDVKSSPTAPKASTETPVVEIKSGDVMDQVINQKTIEMKSQSEKDLRLKSLDPKNVQPNDLKEDDPVLIQTGPKF